MGGGARGDLARAAGERFAIERGLAPTVVVRAPGRVNLIGEHVDYLGGFVLPMAIDRECAAAGRVTDGRLSRLSSGAVGSVEIDLASPVAPDHTVLMEHPWARYIVGVAALLTEVRPSQARNVDAVLETSVPLGGGLSSSASVEVAAAMLLSELWGVHLEPMELARLCQAAEHRYAGVPCGLMDQLTSVMGRDGHALLIDCADGTVTPIALPPEMAIVIANSNVRHELAGGEYAKRRATCEAALRTLGLASFREHGADLQAIARLPADQAPCARHAVTEIDRVRRAAACLRAGDAAAFGRLMVQSHASLRDDFLVSCRELDILVEIAMSTPGVHGARMTGAGFGGCIVAACESGRARSLIDRLNAEYPRASGHACDAFVARASSGASFISRG